MAAGQGFKTFTSGDVLTAADVNGYLMQGVNVFANATERDAEITSPQEGQFAYLKDTNVTTYYTGSAWTNLDTTGMVNPMTTTGDTIYSSSGSTPARLGIGTTGQVLTVSGGVPSWATAGGGFTSNGNRVATNQSTTSSSFVNLATTQSVTLTTGTKAVVWGSFGTFNSSSNALHQIGIAVSGATTIAASLTYGVMVKPPSASQDHYYAYGFFINTLTAGSNTFTLQFNTDSGNATFMNRHLIVADMGS